VRRGLFASLLAGETYPTTRDAGFLDDAAREAARGVGLLDAAMRWCATAGFRIVVLQKSGCSRFFGLFQFNYRHYGDFNT
jgi:hypothetical protein